MGYGDLQVKVGADTTDLQQNMTEASQSVDAATNDMSQSIESAIPAFNDLTAAIVKLQETSARTADATESLKMYQEIATGIHVAMGAATAAMGAATGGAALLAGGMHVAKEYQGELTDAVIRGVLAFRDYAESIAFVERYQQTSRLGADGLTAAIGRLSLQLREYLKGVEIYKSGLIELANRQIAVSGNLDKLQEGARSIGFENATRAVQEFAVELSRIPGMTNDTAIAIQSALATMPNYSAELNQTFIDLISRISLTKEEALGLATSLASAMADPAGQGKMFLDTLKGVDAALYSQLDAATQINSKAQGQAVILDAVAAKYKTIGYQQTQELEEMNAGLQKWGVLGDILGAFQGKARQAALDHLDIINKQVAAYERQADLLRRTVLTMEELTAVAGKVVTTQNGPLVQLENLQNQLTTLDKTLKVTTTDAANMIAKFEDFKPNAYMDKSPGHPELDHWAVGYGQHTIGNQEVTKNSTITEEEAYADMQRKIIDIQNELASRVGASWETLSGRVKASMTSMGYNYGKKSTSLDSMINAAKNGTEQDVANAILARQNDNNGVNKGRRQQEAANITGFNIDPKNVEAAHQIRDAIKDINDLQKGGNEIQRTSLRNLQEIVSGKRDEIGQQENLIKSIQNELDHTETIAKRTQLQNQLAQAKVDLENKIVASKQAQNQLDIASAKTQDDIYKAKVKSAEYNMSLFSANQETAQYKQALLERKNADIEYEQYKTQYARAEEETRYNDMLKDLQARRYEERHNAQEGGLLANFERLQADLELEQEKRKIELGHREFLRDQEKEGTLEHKQAAENLLRVDGESSARRQQILMRDNRMILQDFRQMFDTISSSLSSSLMGIIQGTQKWRDLLRNLITNVTQYFLNASLKFVADWAAARAADTVATIAAEGTKTAAVTAGETARTAAVEAGTLASLGMKAMAIVKSIMSSAAETFAGVFGFMAPLMGPAAAAPAGAAMATVGSMAGMVAMDIGAWSVPKDMPAMVHRNELVMPAAEAGAFRDLLQGVKGGTVGGRAMPHVNASVNIQAMDAQSISRLLTSNNREMLKALGKSLKLGSYVGIKGLGTY